MRSPCPKRFRILDFDTRLHYFFPAYVYNSQNQPPILDPLTPPHQNVSYGLTYQGLLQPF